MSEDDENARRKERATVNERSAAPAPRPTSDVTLAAERRPVVESSVAETMAAPSQPTTMVELDDAVRALGFERYDRKKLLGRGGMGEVQLMKDAQTGRAVAMKVRREGDPASTSGRARFVREARIQAQLEHPAIVPVYDLGLTPDGAEYFTMKRIGGRTLAEVLAARRSGEGASALARNELLGAFRQVCLAVEYAHRRGVLHRDIKPENLMLGELGEVYVLDWGLAKAGGSRAGDDAGEGRLEHVSTGQTFVGSILGTPGYMSPEQAAGNPNLDERSDVFALGAVLYEILTLEPLVRGKSSGELLVATMRGVDVAERLSATDVPPELAQLTMEATRLARDARIATAQELADRVQRFIDGDRDAELRSRLADEHAAAAEAAAETALAGGEEAMAARQLALKEAGRALAVDPRSERAAATLLKMLLEPPAVAPEEVLREVRHEESEEARSAARQGIVTYIMNGAVAIIAGFVLGIHDAWWIVAIVVPQWLAAFFCWYFGRKEQVLAIHVMMVSFLAFLAIGADSGIAGPLILVPGYAAAQLVVNTMSVVYEHRYLMLAMACAAVAVPVGLEYTGFVDPAYAFLSEGIRVQPRAVDLPPLALPLGAVAAILTALVGPAVVTWRQTEVVRSLRRQNHLQAWMLAQLVPEPASASAAAGGAGPVSIRAALARSKGSKASRETKP